VVTGRLTIPTADGDPLHYSAVASEQLESASKAPAAEGAALSCLRRAAALADLGSGVVGVEAQPLRLSTLETIVTVRSQQLVVEEKFFRWHHCQTQHQQPSAYRTTQQPARSTGRRYRLVAESGILLDLIDPKDPVEIHPTLSGALQLCPFPVVPECHRSRLYASARAGLRALMRLPKDLPFIHSMLRFLAQKKTQEC